MRRVLRPGLGLAILLLSGPALADTVTVVRNGLFCASPDALAKLTRPDGSSSADSPYATPQAVEIAKRGGCFHLQLGQTLTATSIRKNTTVVAVDIGDGQGTRAFYFPNIDLRIQRTPVLPGAADTPGQTGSDSADSPQTKATPSGDAGRASASPDAVKPTSYFSTAGLFLEENEADAKAQLANTGFILDETLANGSDLARRLFLAYKKNGDESVGFIVLESRVVYIYHTILFDKGSQPSADAVKQLVINKYGVGDYDQLQGAERFFMRWWFGNDNKPADGRGLGVCGSFGGFATSVINPQVEPTAQNGRIATGAKFMGDPPDPKCHKYISASAEGDIYTHVVTGLVIFMYEADQIWAHQRALENAAAAAQKKQVEDSDKKLAPL